MSIDRTHRRGICHLMKENFAEKQYIITTHENDWANQLRTEGIVTRKNMIHFANWNIDAGPRYKLEKDFWDEIDDDLKNNNIPSAAHKLRRNSECFFELVCDFLEAEIPYRGNHRWELGDLAPAAISTYKKYLKKAKTNSQKIGQNKKFSELNKLEKASSKIIAKSQVEQWIINENVHYNKWTEFSKNDFEPVVDAFRDLYSLFICKSCGSMISKCQARGTAANVVVNCDCGKIFWNIQ
jgi:energy-coupling factor transporter ATP-binding protein EcfA2